MLPYRTTLAYLTISDPTSTLKNAVDYSNPIPPVAPIE